MNKKNNFAKKSIFLLFMLFILGGVSSYSYSLVNLYVEYVNPTPSIPGHGKDPIVIPSLWQDDYYLLLEADHIPYLLALVDDTNSVVYYTDVPTTVTSVTLPSTIAAGDYEIMLIDIRSPYYFYGYIRL